MSSPPERQKRLPDTSPYPASHDRYLNALAELQTGQPTTEIDLPGLAITDVSVETRALFSPEGIYAPYLNINELIALVNHLAGKGFILGLAGSTALKIARGQTDSTGDLDLVIVVPTTSSLTPGDLFHQLYDPNTITSYQDEEPLILTAALDSSVLPRHYLAALTLKGLPENPLTSLKICCHRSAIPPDITWTVVLRQMIADITIQKNISRWLADEPVENTGTVFFFPDSVTGLRSYFLAAPGTLTRLDDPATPFTWRRSLSEQASAGATTPLMAMRQALRLTRAAYLTNRHKKELPPDFAAAVTYTRAAAQLLPPPAIDTHKDLALMQEHIHATLRKMFWPPTRSTLELLINKLAPLFPRFEEALNIPLRLNSQPTTLREFFGSLSPEALSTPFGLGYDPIDKVTDLFLILLEAYPHLSPDILDIRYPPSAGRKYPTLGDFFRHLNDQVLDAEFRPPQGSFTLKSFFLDLDDSTLSFLTLDKIVLLAQLVLDYAILSNPRKWSSPEDWDTLAIYEKYAIIHRARFLMATLEELPAQFSGLAAIAQKAVNTQTEKITGYPEDLLLIACLLHKIDQQRKQVPLSIFVPLAQRGGFTPALDIIFAGTQKDIEKGLPPSAKPAT